MGKVNSFDLPTGPTATTDAAFMRLDTIVSVHMISQRDCSHETLEKKVNFSRKKFRKISKFLTLPQISHLNGRFSANS